MARSVTGWVDYEAGNLPRRLSLNGREMRDALLSEVREALDRHGIDVRH